MTRRGSSYAFTSLATCALVVSFLIASPTIGGASIVGSGGGTDCAPSTNAALDANVGQYIPVNPPIKVLDTRESNDPAGYTSPAAAGNTLVVPVVGAVGLPSSGISAVLLNVSAISPTGSGSLTDYQDGTSDSGHQVVTFQSGQSANGVDVVTPGASGSVDIGVYGASSVNVAASVRGYFTDGSEDTPGQTYVSANPTYDLLDTRSGLGGYSGALSHGQSVNILFASGNNDVAESGVDGVVVSVGAINGSSSGYLVDGPAGASTSVPALLSYNANEVDRQTDYVPLATSGANAGSIEVTNEGSGTVNLQVELEGYFLDPADTCAGDSEAQILPPSALPLNGAGATQLTIGANATVNIPEEGQGPIPSAGVDAVLQEVEVLAPAASGWLSVYPYGSQDPDLSVLNFVGGDNGDETFSNTLPTSLGGEGTITVTNHSSGTLKLSLLPSGYWTTPVLPANPDITTVTNASGYDTVNWLNPGDDGGAPVLDYAIRSSNGDQTQVNGNVSEATIASGPADEITVTAANGVGSGEPSDSVSEQDLASLTGPTEAEFPITISGTVLPPSGSDQTVPAGLDVTLAAADTPVSGQTANDIVGTLMTQAGGAWSYTLDSFDSLSPAVQGIATNDEGYLNLDITTQAYGLASSNESYAETAIGATTVFVGATSDKAVPLPQTVDLTLQAGVPGSLASPSTVTSDLSSEVSSTPPNDPVGDVPTPGAVAPTQEADPNSTSDAFVAPTLTTGSYLGKLDSGDSGVSAAPYQPNVAVGNVDLTNAPIQAPESQPASYVTAGDSMSSYESWCLGQTIPETSPQEGILHHKIAVEPYTVGQAATTSYVPAGLLDSGLGFTDQLSKNNDSATAVTVGVSLDADNLSLGGSQTVTNNDSGAGVDGMSASNQQYPLEILHSATINQQNAQCMVVADFYEAPLLEQNPSGDWVSVPVGPFMNYVTNFGGVVEPSNGQSQTSCAPTDTTCPADERTQNTFANPCTDANLVPRNAAGIPIPLAPASSATSQEAFSFQCNGVTGFQDARAFDKIWDSTTQSWKDYHQAVPFHNGKSWTGSTSSTVGFSISAWVLNYSAQTTYSSTTDNELFGDTDQYNGQIWVNRGGHVYGKHEYYYMR